MNKDDIIAILALPIVLLLGYAFTIIIGSPEWADANIQNACIPVTFAFAIQWVAFVPSYLLKTEHYYDLVGGSTFITVAAITLLIAPDISLRSSILFLMIVVWASRLSIFLFFRVKKSGKDSRFDQIKQSFPRFLFAWTTQGLWVTFTLAPALAVILMGKDTGVDAFLIIGSLIWLFGISFELIADLQKMKFKNQQSNKGKFINTGLWALSRHPNYFGEITLWIGVSIIALPLLSGWQYLTLSSPLFIFCLLRYVSGIPILEKSADKKWGHLDAYYQYKRKVPRLLPKMPW